jgi:serine protease Do
MTLQDTGRGAVSAEVVSSAGARMVEHAQRSVVQMQSRNRGAGAGVIWDKDGLVLTNHHVVAGRRLDGRVRVIQHDDRAFEAEVVKRGRDLDLALVRIKDGPGDLPVAPVGDSDKLRVGELVYAIGHPWGRLGTVTAGIVSGLGTARYVESDIALAPGNSGGPLLNARGEVVGINAMIYGNVALSIPSNAASAWVAGAGERRPRLGVALLPADLPAYLRGAHGETGLVIAGVEGGSPAERAGLLVGDVLVGVDDEPLGGFESLLDALAHAGNSVWLRVMRGGKVSFVEVSFGASGRAA